jgi:hypothetical protein
VNKNAGISRFLFGVAAVIFMLGAAAHAKAFFGSASRIIDAATVKSFFAGELKVLWLADSSTLMGLAVLSGLMAARPGWAARPLMLCLSWIPAATTAMLYFYLGPFYAAHMLLAATLMVIVAAMILPANGVPSRQAAAARAAHPIPST